MQGIGSNCETPEIHEHRVQFNRVLAVRPLSQRNTFWGAVAAATWFESLAVASRPLQRRLAETNLNPSWSAKHASETAVIFQFFGIGE